MYTEIKLEEVFYLIFSNEEEIVEDRRVSSPIGGSDHAVITFTIGTGLEEKACNKKI